MNLIHNMKVSIKLMLIMAVAAVAMLTISFVGYNSLNNADEAMESMYKQEMQGVQHLGKAVEWSRIMMVKTLQGVMLQGHTDRLKKVKDQKKEAEDGFEQNLSEYKAAMKGTPYEDTSEIDQQWANYKNIMNKVITLAEAGNPQEAMTVYEKDGSPATRGLRDALHGQQDARGHAAHKVAQLGQDVGSGGHGIIPKFHFFLVFFHYSTKM